jgi:hypothetical protein
VVQTRLVEPEATFLARLDAYGRELEQAREDVKERRKGLFVLWSWLNKIVALAAAWLVGVPGFAGKAAAKEGSAASFGPAATVTPLPVAAQATLWTVTTLATGAIVAGVLPAGQLELVGTWELDDVQVVFDGVYDPPEFEGGVLEIEPAEEGDHFVVARGPALLEGTTLDPRLTSDDVTIAVSERLGRGACIDTGTGAVLAEDIYEVETRWEFLRVDDEPRPSADIDRLRFVYSQTFTKNRFDPGSEGCRELGTVEITASAVRAGGS